MRIPRQLRTPALKARKRARGHRIDVRLIANVREALRGINDNDPHA